VVLSHVLWRYRFGSDAAMLGRDIVLNGEPYTVVGILPQGGPFDRAAAQIWIPLAFDPTPMTRDYRWLGASARLKPGVTLEKARAEMELIGGRLAAAYPASNKGWGVAVDRLADVLISPGLKTAVTVLFAATLLVLLIGCANLASLAVARGISRENEMAVRATLGAGRWHLIRQLLVEHLVVALCGGTVAVGVGYAMLQWIESLIPPSALPPAIDIRMDPSVLLFTLSLTVVTGLLFGVAPAVQMTNSSLVRLPTGVGQSTTTNRVGRRMRSRLIVAEVALAFVLLVASGLLMRSFFKLLDIDPGFNATNVLTARVPILQEQHPDPVELNTYLSSITAAVEAVPGVRETALSSALPLQGWGYGVGYAIAGGELVDLANRRRAFFKIVSPPYFDALGIKLLAGRVLNDADRSGSTRVALINETLAGREFPGESPIGRRILAPEIVPGKTEFGPEVAWEIVGVIAGERITGLGDAITPGLYVSNQQSPTYNIELIVRTDLPPQSLQRAIQSAVHRVSKDQPLSEVLTLEHIVDQSMMGTRIVGTILAAFAAVALLLAAVGIYGVTSDMALQRRREIAIRAALGASVVNLRTLLFWGGMRLMLIGLAIGLASMVPVSDVLSAMLYGVGTYDVPTIAVVAALLALVGGLASVLPAVRMTKGDPLEALRYR
jgi:putative ABC transport system permease protein